MAKSFICTESEKGIIKKHTDRCKIENISRRIDSFGHVLKIRFFFFNDRSIRGAKTTQAVTTRRVK